MYVCLNCGADLKFDAVKKKMVCDYCDSFFDPNDPRLVETEAGGHTVVEQPAAENRDEIQVTVFTCPQCGAEMYSSDNDATAFCSFCGASNVLTARLAGIHRPARIIPFGVSKDSCRKKYRSMAAKAIYAPRVFRDSASLDRMRALYVPYWLYNVDLDGTAMFSGVKESYEGVSIHETASCFSCQVKGNVRNIPFDASAAFDDTIAEKIAPFDIHKSKAFNTAYLAGAYANIPDVESGLYRDDALDKAADRVLGGVSGDKALKTYSKIMGPDQESSRGRALPVAAEKAETALFPVWFLSFRRGNRVAYAAMNGQTGKMNCDFPVSPLKFMIASLIAAIPLFLVLNMFVTMKPFTGLFVACVLALAALLLYSRNYETIRQRDLHESDKGYQSTGQVAEDPLGPLFAGPLKGIYERRQAAREREKRMSDGGKQGRIVRWVLNILGVVPFVAVALLLSGYSAPLLLLIAAVICGARSAEQLKGHIRPEAAALCLTVLAGIVIMLIYPVSDLWFYGGTLLVLAGVIYALLSVIRQYNLLATRPLPQLKGVKTEKQYRQNSPNTGRRFGRGAGMMILLLAGCLALACPLSGFTARNETLEETFYENPDTGYTARVVDPEDLFTAREEADLLEEMIPLTKYGHALCLSDTGSQSFYSEAETRYRDYLGDENGTMLYIDMGIRELGLHSHGWNYKVISDDRGSVIADNVYKYASRGLYYECASEAFREVGVLLAGGRISQPMKYINNILLAVILGILFNYVLMNILMPGSRNSSEALLAAPDGNVRVAGFRKEKTLGTVAHFSLGLLFFRIILFALEHGLTGGGGGGRSGGGGSRGGGGSHKF